MFLNIFTLIASDDVSFTHCFAIYWSVKPISPSSAAAKILKVVPNSLSVYHDFSLNINKKKNAAEGLKSTNLFGSMF